MKNTESVTALSDEQAENLRSQGLGNQPAKRMTKSYRQILSNNIFSLFNIINVIIAAALVYVGSYKNCLFLTAVVLNTLIGIIQEIRSKRVLDRLSVITEQTAEVYRSGNNDKPNLRNVNVCELVKGDVIKLSGGRQVPNDCVVITGVCEVNEALLTGESDSVVKDVGDRILSGSFVTGGSCLGRITAVGGDNYAESITRHIKNVDKTRSEIMRFLDRIIAVLSKLIVPIGLLMFYNQVTRLQMTLKEAVESCGAAVIGMIPEGLVLLSSAVFALGVVRLSKENVLSRDLYSLEALARTDVLCLDKTGTLTTGKLTVVKTEGLGDVDIGYLENVVSVFAALSVDDNKTISAIRRRYNDARGCKAESVCPFSSERKWSSVTTDKHGTIVAGSVQALFGMELYNTICKTLDISEFRVLAIAECDAPVTDRKLSSELRPLGLVLMREELRDGAVQTLKYFQSQGVRVKIISGDDPLSVRRLCGAAFGDEEEVCDLSGVSNDALSEMAAKYSVFGRASPEQKRLIVQALRNNGHTVTMVGDGVNDVPALCESDCSISPAAGSDAAKGVSQLVMLDSDLSSLPYVVAEGRRSINNLQSSSSLFLSKTVFSVVMAVIFMLADLEYPFSPIRMTLISTLTIGLPSFVLSFIENNKPLSGSIAENILKKALPAALINVIIVMFISIYGKSNNFTNSMISSMCVIAMAVTGLMLIFSVYRPLTPLKLAVLCASAAGFVLAFGVFNGFFGLEISFGQYYGDMVILTIFHVSVLVMLLWTAEKASELCSVYKGEIFK